MNATERLTYFKQLVEHHATLRSAYPTADALREKSYNTAKYPCLMIEDEPDLLLHANGDGHMVEDVIVLYVLVQNKEEKPSLVQKSWEEARRLVADILYYTQNYPPRDGLAGAPLHFDATRRPAEAVTGFTHAGLRGYRLVLHHNKSIATYDESRWQGLT